MLVCLLLFLVEGAHGAERGDDPGADQREDEGPPPPHDRQPEKAVPEPLGVSGPGRKRRRKRSQSSSSSSSSSSSCSSSASFSCCPGLRRRQRFFTRWEVEAGVMEAQTQGRRLKASRTDAKRVTRVCSDADCKFFFSARKLGVHAKAENVSQWQVQRLQRHTCVGNTSGGALGTRTASKAAGLMLMADITMSTTPKQVHTLLKFKTGVHLSYKEAYNARKTSLSLKQEEAVRRPRARRTRITRVADWRKGMRWAAGPGETGGGCKG